MFIVRTLISSHKLGTIGFSSGLQVPIDTEREREREGCHFPMVQAPKSLLNLIVFSWSGQVVFYWRYQVGPTMLRAHASFGFAVHSCTIINLEAFTELYINIFDEIDDHMKHENGQKKTKKRSLFLQRN